MIVEGILDREKGRRRKRKVIPTIARSFNEINNYWAGKKGKGLLLGYRRGEMVHFLPQLLIIMVKCLEMKK